MANIPLMIVSDSVTAPTGLGRIARELAMRIHANLSDTFELASVGYGGTYSRKFPWRQYSFNKLSDWTIPELPFICQDFCGERKGILLWIWNSSWAPWVADPSILPEGDLKRFLQEGRMEHWIYVPIDSECIGGKLVASQGEILKGFNRVLAYTKFGADVIDRSCGWAEGVTEYLPHGTDQQTFYPRERKEARACFIEKVLGKKGVIADDVLLLGIVATNSARKDWGLGFEVCAELLKRGVNVGLWAHTDAVRKSHCWDLTTLADEFGMRDRVIFSNAHLDDDAMAWGYNACNATLGIGSEGWGYPLSESLACGVPCITGDYAGATEFVPAAFRVKPAAYRYDGYYANKRPVFWASTWADRAMEAVKSCGPLTVGQRKVMPMLDPKYQWNHCWQGWSKWLQEGVNG